MTEENPARRGDKIEVGTISPERLSQIKQRCRDSQYGYIRIGYIEYFADISELLREREHLLDKINNQPKTNV